MRIRIQNELLLINVITVLLIIFITLFPFGALRIALGLPFVLFFPGYTLIAALFPRKSQLDSIERIAFSFGMSIPLVGFIGFLLNFTPLGIRLESVLYSVASFIFIFSIIAWLRRRQLPAGERFGIEFRARMPGWGGGVWDRALSMILVIAIVGVLGMLGYVIAAPKIGERFTELYLLGVEGKAEGYPKELVVGQEAKVIVGIINREHETISYQVEVTIDGERNEEIGPRVLGHEQKWETETSFIPVKVGENQKVEFMLYKEGKPYNSLHFWIDVIR